jgi:hypothetical protein
LDRRSQKLSEGAFYKYKLDLGDHNRSRRNGVQAAGFFRSVLIVISDIALSLAPIRLSRAPQASLEWSVRLSYLGEDDRNVAERQAGAQARRTFFYTSGIAAR